MMTKMNGHCQTVRPTECCRQHLPENMRVCYGEMKLTLTEKSYGEMKLTLTEKSKEAATPKQHRQARNSSIGLRISPANIQQSEPRCIA